MKVKSTRISTYHYIGTCSECGWEVQSTGSDIDKCRRQVIKHVNDTGHDVNVERGSATRYSLVNV